MAIRIAPSLLAADFGDIAGELARIEGADWAHIYIMDNHFVPQHVAPGSGRRLRYPRLSNRSLADLSALRTS